LVFAPSSLILANYYLPLNGALATKESSVNKIKYIAIASTLFLTACVTTPYQKAGFLSSTGGYEDEQLSEGVYFIKSKVNANTKPQISIDYWHRRAAELCGHSEYKAEVSTSFDTNVNPDPYSSTSQWPIASGKVFCNQS
jgi:hypothetical protein